MQLSEAFVAVRKTLSTTKSVYFSLFFFSSFFLLSFLPCLLACLLAFLLAYFLFFLIFFSFLFSVCLSFFLSFFLSLPFPQGRSIRYSERLHDFSVTIPRCYKDVYVNSFFPCTGRLWNFLPIESGVLY